MNNLKKILCGVVVGTMLVLSAGCTRVGTGEVGLRVDASKQVQGAELQPGTFNQELIGDVLIFPVRDIQVDLENKTPMTSDNSALEDFDMSLVYSISPSAVSDLFIKKSKTFHAVSDKGEVYLMFNYIHTLANNAAYKAIADYTALGVAKSDSRNEIERKIHQIIAAKLREEGLETALSITAVNVRNIKPNAAILAAATNAIKAQSELAQKNTEIQIAEAESKRMQALANNSKQSVDYMNAQAKLLIAQGIREGKVRAIVVPFDFKGQVVVQDNN